MRQVRILECAAEEASEAAGWYESRQAGLGKKFYKALDHAISLIEENLVAMFPWNGKAGLLGAYHLPLYRFPYSIIALEHDDQLVVVAVAHHSRKPGYWTGREC
jgi:toxin ParE1/3/4